jgi:hypothetical protein
VNHLDAALARLPEQYKNQANFVALVGVLVSQKQDIEDALQAALDQRTVEGATGVTLETLGRLVGRLRTGLPDDRMRTWIRIQMLLNRCSGSIPEILTLASLMVPGGTRVTLDEVFPGHITVTLGVGAEAIDPTDAGNIVLAAKAGGVQATTISPVTSDANAFTLDDLNNPAPLATQGLGDTGNGATGGGLATVI